MKCLDILEAWDDLHSDFQAMHETMMDNLGGFGSTAYEKFIADHLEQVKYYAAVRTELVRRLGAELTAELLAE